MKNLIILIALLVSTQSINSITPIIPTFKKWTKLGSKTVNYGLDRDVIHVGLKDGVFTKLKVEVTGGSLNMHKMVVEYRNGQKETIRLRHNFRKGSGSQVIDLAGGHRIIKDITFWYDTKGLPRKKAKIHVFGKH